MTLLEHLQSIPDPRVQRTRRHELQSLLTVALCATLAGADNWVEVAEFGQQHEGWFARIVPLPSGIASHDTFARVFRLLQAQPLEHACQQWLQELAGQVQGTVAIDGKSVRGSAKADRPRALHLVSAWAADMGLLLGQCQVDGKSNEITAIPQLLQLLHLAGCIVTIDAMGCQKEIAAQLQEQGADYVLSLKANQRHLHAVVQKHFEGAGLQQQAQAERESPEAPELQENVYVESFRGHGRQERRSYRVHPIPEALRRAAAHWPGLKGVVRVERERQQKGQPTGHEASREVSYYLSSLPESTPAHVLAHSIRAHWSVENQLHWSLDVALREDAAQSYKDQGPYNQALLRRMALQMLKSDTSVKIGLQAKRKRAGWNLDYLAALLGLSR
ncbi:ISAs1 family transposase [Acidovorax sp. NCPPB 4044]|uniref:ISAs1 family transposase n=1 Tax=Acidovorax sp. NCPPB 4044 TaxID=2940490 RepID=UPI002303CE15|nr:ISAs1 family transposase [Acidovorax sp. NCPPB 4044]MDA8520029.1 ISAs1 family transposase [Acidovorax sp. NCPPB 4044]MDA8522109.1 ISAs1 family transposase [Acidovorax sp. NCPPB 4044]